jgi:GTPase SAR1 family protein
MNSKWRQELYLKEDIYLGDLKEKDEFKNYYFSDSINKAINDFKEYTSDKNIFYPILLAGDAGSGKTSLVNYLYSHNIFNGYTIILNLDPVTSTKPLFEQISEGLEEYYREISNINEDINNKYINYQEIKSKLSYFVKIKNILRLHNIISKDIDIRQSEKYQNLIIVIDQIDMLNSKQIEKRIKEIFSVLEESHFIHKIVCSRYDTLKICKAIPNSFFATVFRRQIKIEPSKIEKVIDKRLECVSLGMHISKPNFDSFFNNAKIRLIEELSSNNVRFALGIFIKFFEMHKPDKEIKTNAFFINFLISNDYIPNINGILSVNDGVKIPSARIIFEALDKYNIIDNNFYDLLNQSLKKSMKTDKYCIAINRQTIQNSIKLLKELLLITESTFDDKQFLFTKRGQFILDIIKEYAKVYNKLYPFADKEFDRFKVS